jgi:predicted amidohydrolase
MQEVPAMSPETKPRYEMVPLRRDEINVVVVQSVINKLDPVNPQKKIKENLDRLLQMVDMAAWVDMGYRRPKDLICFHEFPLQGFSEVATREEQLRLAIDVPGPETEAIGKKAKQYKCYIHFGCYGKIKEWPNHFMNLGVIVGPSGDIIYRKWKLRNLSGFGFSTTVFDVLDQYVEMYGWDAVFPVARTDIGNLAVMPCVREPEIGRAFALKGAEILIRYMTAGNGYCEQNPFSLRGGKLLDTFRVDLQAISIANHIYSVFVNNSLSPEVTFADLGAGGSAIYDAQGVPLMEAATAEETAVMATLPLAAYRKWHEIPRLPKELFTDIAKRYVSKFPPNCFAKHLPNSLQDAGEQYAKMAKW